MRSPPRRSGAILVAAMVCLLVTVSILSTMITGTIRQRLQLRPLHRVRQAELLLVSARDRAYQQILRDADYDGETWTPMLFETPDPTRANVTIQLQSADDQTSQQVEITVVYPTDDPRSVRRSGLFKLPNNIPSDSSQEDS